jgi:hypothetical protein
MDARRRIFFCVGDTQGTLLERVGVLIEAAEAAETELHRQSPFRFPMSNGYRGVGGAGTEGCCGSAKVGFPLGVVPETGSSNYVTFVLDGERVTVDSRMRFVTQSFYPILE